MDSKEFVEIEIDIAGLYENDDLITKINSINFEDNKYYKLIFIGNRNFEITVNEIKKLINCNQVIKIKDKTKLAIDFEKIAKENSLKGIFIRELLNKINEHPEEKEKILKVIEIGIEAMDT